MADDLGIMLTELPEAESVSDNDLLYLVSGNNSEKVKASTLKGAVNKVQVPEVISTGDKACYVKRAIPTAGALAEGQKIVGATLAWNQKGDYTGIPSSTVNGIIVTNNNDGSFTLSGQANGSAIIKVSDDFDIASGHVYINFGCPSGGASNTYRIDSRFTDGSQSGQVMDVNALDTGSGDIGKITTVGTSTKGALYIRIENGYTINKTFKPQYVDLTQLFGSTIADAIYQMEQTTAGSGVAFFKKYFPEDYYAYESGELESVNVSAHKAVGKNLFNKANALSGQRLNTVGELYADSGYFASEFMAVSKGTYIYNAPTFDAFHRICIYSDENQTSFVRYVQNTGTITIASGENYVRICGSESDINTAQFESGNRVTDYSPYYENIITLDSSKEFRGLYELVNGELRANGDVYEADGTVTRKYGKVTTFSRGSVDSSGKLYQINNNLVNNVSLSNINAISNYYPIVDLTTCRTNTDSGIKSICLFSTSVYISGFIGQEAELDNILSSLEIVYELATQTTETATPYTNPQLVDADGTEEFVDYKVSQGTRDVAIPVGHESSFYDYTDGSITIPDLPFADGTYALSVTMNNGTPTFSWESNS